MRPPPDAAEGEPPRYSVVIVDDHALVRSGMVALLDDEPWLRVVGQSGSLPDALALARGRQPDLMLLDLTIGDELALGAIPELLAAAPRMRIVVVTMHDDPALARRALSLGASGYLLKEAAAEDLVSALRAVARGHVYLHPRLGARLALDESDLGELSGREREVLALVAAGWTNGEIAAHVHVSLRTVEAQRASVRRKLGLSTRAELAAYAREHGLLT